MEILKSLYNCQNFPICSGVVLLSMIQFSTKVCYGMEAHFLWHISIEYCSKGFSAGMPACALCAGCHGSCQISLAWVLSSCTASAVEMHSPMIHPI